MMRRVLLPALLWCWAARGPAESGRITVVYTSEAQPYVEALEGLRGAMGNSIVNAVDLHAADGSAQLKQSLESGGNRLFVTIGKDALETVGTHKLDAPLLATMIMHSELTGKQRVAGAVKLDLPLAGILAELKSVFPQKNRIAVLHNPALPAQIDATAVAKAKQLGFVLQVVDAASPEETIRALRSLKGKVDFVVCLPDSTMYNSATVKPLILASLESHLPMVGFSQNFVRAGAAIGVYPDFRDIGAQTGELAHRQLSGQAAVPEEGPRRLVIAVNQRVMRLLGMEYRETGVVVVR